MIPPDQRKIIAEDPTRRQMLAYEPTEHQTKLTFRDVPSALVIVTPTQQIWREDFFAPKAAVPIPPPEKPVEPAPTVQTSKISPQHFVETIAVNVDNEKLSDKDFRQFIRNTLPIVKFQSA